MLLISAWLGLDLRNQNHKGNKFLAKFVINFWPGWLVFATGPMLPFYFLSRQDSFSFSWLWELGSCGSIFA